MVKVLGNNTFLDETKLIKMVILSGFVHFLALFLFVFLPNLSSEPTIRIIPQYTPVALIGPGDLGGGGNPGKPVTVPKAQVNVAVKKPELIQKRLRQSQSKFQRPNLKPQLPQKKKRITPKLRSNKLTKQSKTSEKGSEANNRLQVLEVQEE